MAATAAATSCFTVALGGSVQPSKSTDRTSQYAARFGSFSSELVGAKVTGSLAANALHAKAEFRVAKRNVRSMRIDALAQRAEYIWMDGLEGQKGVKFNEMRSKTKVIQKPIPAGSLDFPSWSFDGSSTGQAEGRFSDCILQPVYTTVDPIRGGEDVLVLCEVLNPDGTPHVTNTRSKIKKILTSEILAEETLFGFEQEYTMLGKDARPYGWPSGGYPYPQGPFYCGVGIESVYGRPLAEAHMDACIKAGLLISGINAEVMPGQWEFQIGPAGPLQVGDHVMIARWLLHRLGEDFGITCTFEPKPVPEGDWNGTGAHTNYSTKSMRAEGGISAIEAAIEKLSKKHKEHIANYGIGNEKRLTGLHETANINTFKSGVADRGASIRIPLPVSLEKKGYLEDRRPAANVDPYVVARMLIETTLA
eukprot:TRINITY_DN21672_c0_g1_i1.p1 TRINITY_DN21672_c0_g1~~TRINITY_DN21672_c0_g1_i1.p1  ORF type:complete len:421 (+),score=76.40 TRINITY_DN21672_c0_g1_i1:96-1358(+)